MTLFHVLINHRIEILFLKNQCTTMKCTKHVLWVLEMLCVENWTHKVSNHWQNSMIFPGWFFQIPWFFQVFGAFSKFHDFSRSGIFFFSFSRFPWFFQRLETLFIVMFMATVFFLYLTWTKSDVFLFCEFCSWSPCFSLTMFV